MSKLDRESYDELMANANRDDQGSRLYAASMIMDRCGDEEMATVLRTLSAQMDFDDNLEATGAIDRTRAKLDELIAERKGHNSNWYIRTLCDSEILELSNGEVINGDYDYIKSEFYKGGLFDPDIFGGSGVIPFYDDENDRMPIKSYGIGIGHIQLPVHVIIRNDYEIIGNLLGISEDDVERVAKYSAYLVMDPGTSEFNKFSVITEQELAGHKDANLSVAIGGDAIYEALKGLHYSDEPERMAFSVLPVASPKIRPVAFSKENDSFCDYPLNRGYEKVVFMANRAKKVTEMGAPDIILRNEYRQLDDAVNSLVDMARNAIKQTHWSRSKMHSFMLSHLNLILRLRDFGLVKATPEELKKTAEITSLNLFPENIKLVNENGETETIPLQAVLDHDADVIYNYQQENAIYFPVDFDESTLDSETKKRIDDLDEKVKMMENYKHDIVSMARKNGENCTVEFDEDLEMYVLTD